MIEHPEDLPERPKSSRRHRHPPDGRGMDAAGCRARSDFSPAGDVM